MSIVVTMLQTRRGEDGTPWVAGGSYSASDGFARDLMTHNYAVGSAPSVWLDVPSIFRVRVTGSGTVRMDARDSLGNITLSVDTFSASGAADQIEFPYAGDNVIQVRFVSTGTATAEVI